MSPAESPNDPERLREQRIALESQAGITQAMERAREGRFIPLGAMGDEASPEEYFADEHDHLRDKTRDAYFSVANEALRKQLIATQRNIEKEGRRSLEADVVAANHAVGTAKAKLMQQPWSTAALVAAGTVGIGYWLFSIAGAIAGAVAGFFLGQGIVAAARRSANAELEQAMQELEQARKAQSENALWPESFSIKEEVTGERDSNLDNDSAYANVLRGNRDG
jgi:hypothetical protein